MGVEQAHRERVQAQVLGVQVDLALMGECDLGGSEPAHGPAEGVVGVDPEALNVDVFDCVGAGGVHRGAVGDRRAVGGIGARVADDRRLHGEQAPVFIGAGLHAHAERMALGRGEVGLFARVDVAHRPPQVEEGEPDEALDVQVELGPEPAAGGGLDDADLFVRQSQQGHDVLVIVVGILGGGMDDQGPVAVDEPGPGVGLDSVVLDEGRPVGLLDDAPTLFERLFRVPPPNCARYQDVALGVDPGRIPGHGLLGVEHRREIPVDDLDGLERLLGGRFGLGGH